MRDLLRENLDHAAAGSQNVAQAQNCPAGGKDNLFGDALGGAHYGSRLDGLICGEQHHASAVRGGHSG